MWCVLVMSGYNNQYDPSELFRDWLQKGGKAQAEFMKNFGALMANQTAQNFDPMDALKKMAETTQKTQGSVIENIANIQNKGLESMLSMGQLLPNFLNWGAYKTSVGSNGRISIPEAERNALDLEEGDLVQVIVLPISKSKNREVKK